MKIFLLLFIVLFQGTPLLATHPKPVLRAVIVGDTVTPESQIAAQCNVSRMEKSLQVIAQNIECQLQLSLLVDDNFTVDSVENWLHGLPKKSNDIIFFYYTGHGGQDGLSKPWPVLSIYPRNSPPQGLGGSAVVKYLKHNSQRLAIILFECCNTKPKDTDHISHILRNAADDQEVMMSDNDRLPGLRTLFRKQKGLIIAASSRPGEVSFYQDDSLPIGGTFLVGFTKALINLCKEKSVSQMPECQA